MRRTHYTFLLVAFLCFSFYGLAQRQKNTLLLTSDTVSVVPNIHIDSLEHFNRKAFKQGNAFVIIQFDTIPNQEIRKELAANGIVLLNYIPNNAFSAVVKGKFT